MDFAEALGYILQRRGGPFKPGKCLKWTSNGNKKNALSVNYWT